MSQRFQKIGRYTSYSVTAELPHPKLQPEVFVIIHRVLIRAFELLREEDQPLATMLEPPITRNLARAIENRLLQTREVPGFAPPLFERVIREYECDNFDGTLEEKCPDLFFGIRADDSFRSRIQSDQWGVFAECKPVDRTHTVGAKKMYCDGGIHRFIRGDYAWAMQDALMVAFVRDGYRIQDHLGPEMADDTTLCVKEPVSPLGGDGCEEGHLHEALHVSVHSRTFDWTEGRGPAAPITIYHSWHNCTYSGDLGLPLDMV